MKAAVLLFSLTISIAAWGDSTSETRQARIHYNRGLAHFNLQEYERAIPEFEEAYREVPDPSFLYNLAQAHRLANHVERALHFYRAFLNAVPDAENRAEVERHMAELERASEAHRPAAATPSAKPPADESSHDAHATAASLTAAPPPSPTPAHTPAYKKWWVWTLVGVAAAGAGVGLGLGLTQTAHVNSYPGLSF